MTSDKFVRDDRTTQRWDPRTVGIALGVYRPNPEWLAEQLASIATQTHSEWICVLTLDSPLRDIAAEPALAPFLKDKRFVWVENAEQLGLRANFEKAIQLVLEAQTDLVAFCDQDDVWLPTKLAESVAAIRSRGPLTMVYCDAYLLVGGTCLSERLHEYTLKTKKTMSVAERIIQPQVSGFCALLDASLVRLHPTIPAELPLHDHWYSIVAANYGGVFRINQPLALYRQHQGNTIGITAVRVAQGWNTTPALQKYSGLRDNARLRAEIARRVGIELPRPWGLQFLYRHAAGWFLILVGVMINRLFSDRLLAKNAYLRAWGLLLPAASQREFVQQVRKRLPAQFKILRMLFAVVVVLLIFLILVAAQVGSFSSTTIATVVFACLFVVSQAITGLRYLQHQMPLTSELLVGIGALSGLLAQLFGAGVWLASVASLLPVFANGMYRLRWALRP